MADIQVFEKAFTYFLAMLFCLTIHEAAHALVAKWQGDHTAEREGRLTLNPIPHIDLLGTVILPMIGALASMPILGWAKPVPIDPRNFKSPWGNVLVAAAGPVSNLIFCVVCLFGLGFLQRFLDSSGADILNSGTATGTFLVPFARLLLAMVWVNAILAVFNLIPLPPLDGAAILEIILPPAWVERYESVVRPYGTVILMVLVISGGLFWVSQVANGFVTIAQHLVNRVFMVI